MDKLEWNRPRFKKILGESWPEKDPIQESWFIKVNDPVNGNAIWLKFTAMNNLKFQKADYEAWAMIFPTDKKENSVLAFKELYESVESLFERSLGFTINGCIPVETFKLTIGGCTFVQEDNQTIVTKGKLKSKNGSVEWDLTLKDSSSPLLLFPFEGLYNGAFPKRKPVSPFPNALANGEVIVQVDSKKTKYTFNNAPAMQGHNWGSEHSYRYVWSHINYFEEFGTDVVFEGYSGKIKVGPFVTPWITGLALRFTGSAYAKTNVKEILFLDIASMLSNSAKVDYQNFLWQFEGKKGDYKLKGMIQADSDKIAGLNYDDPDGKRNYCYNSKTASAKITLFYKNKELLVMSTKNTAAIELLTDNKHTAVPVLV
ncbi:MAG: hypothetical protein D6767_06640 [Candidatus Hydrogenedentota bacterium]|nr:MAG: hypothetical protein D6767_06640 [Candidatus Hydrogenedentota bacterium]